MRRVKAVCLAFCLLLGLGGPVFAQMGPPQSFDEAVKQANEEIFQIYHVKDFYQPTNFSGGKLSKETWEQGIIPDWAPSREWFPHPIVYNASSETSKKDAYKNGSDPNSSRWGHDGTNTYRYLGFTKQGYPYSNSEHPFDSGYKGQYLDTMAWIEAPWNSRDVNKNVFVENPEKLMDFFNAGRFNKITDPEALKMIDRSAAMGLCTDAFGPERQSIISPLGFDGFPWHKYVYIYHPPTTYNWGIGRMFIYIDPEHPDSSDIGYKTVMLAPLCAALPDFSLAAKQLTYSGEPGKTVTIPITVKNNIISVGGSPIEQADVGIKKASTDLKAAWYGGGWDNPVWSIPEGLVELADEEEASYQVPITVPQVGQETRLVFKTNIDGKTPESEPTPLQDNNSIIVNVVPDGVDLAITAAPVFC